MKKIFIAVILIIVSINYILGQTSYLKLIEKGKYSAVDKKINKELSKKPDDIGLNFTMAVLLIERKNKNYNPEEAYIFLMKSRSLYDNSINEQEIKRLNKIPINANIFNDYTDTICKRALEDATTINTIESYTKFIDFYIKSPLFYIEKACENRNKVAYEFACRTNTVGSYQYFISNYSHASQINEAKNKRNHLAFLEAKSIDTIEKYKSFISQYPDANEVKEGWERIHELAYELAFQNNSSKSYRKFILEYPNSKQYVKAFNFFEEKLFFETTSNGDWASYKSFINENKTSSWVPVAQDSILFIALNKENIEALKYCVDNFTGNKRVQPLILYHDLFTNDGERKTLDLFYDKYDCDALEDIKINDYLVAELGENLQLGLTYSSLKFTEYDQYIRLAAPREKAYVALQRMISADVANKAWLSAKNKVQMYSSFFGIRHKKLNDLISILNAKLDASIIINSFGNSINNLSGDEYSPFISADDKLVYFCGRDRVDNIGGEDIFVSKKVNGKWTSPNIIYDLSSRYSNDAPECISNDGTTMILFKSGDLYHTDKNVYGWSQAVKLPEQINAGDWQADVVISSDGKALLFASTKPGGYNLYPRNSDIFHGGYNYSSDIYVSLLDENNEWGEAINLGSVINTPYCDRSPFLHPDMKTLYFSSDGHGGLGDLDVYKSTRLSDDCWDCWSEPVNMGKEINTAESDWGYKISTDGEKAYFSKDNGKKGGSYDIYYLSLPKHLRPDLVATISGKLVDKDNQPLSAEIRWEDLETGKTIGQSKSDPTDGSFFIILPLGKIYGYYVDKVEYFPISNNIDLRKSDKSIQIENNIDMVTYKQMIEEGTAVPVNNLFFNFSESALLPYSIPELKRVAAIIKANDLRVEISGHTDNIGDEKKNQILSEERAKSVQIFLINEGCLAQKMIILGYGESKTIVSNETDSGRAKNRRVELKFIKD